MKNLKKYLHGFTLVELIIVITILAILATIAFVSFQNYTRDARDSNRVTTLSNLSNGFEIFYTKVGNYPIPDSPVAYTGGNTTIQMGILSDTVSKLIGVDSIPKDPQTNQNYVYSVGGNGYYYQIAGEKENTQASIFSQTYAAGEIKIPVVKGNYKMDPSLPSLLPVKSSVSSSGIFDPSVCFITDGGSNNFSSTSTNCIKKKDMSLKSLDSSLVGYWDMETLSGSNIRDLSQNNHDLIFSGGLSISSSTGGILGKGLIFDGTGFLYSIENTGSNLEINNTTINNGDFTLTALIKPTFNDFDQYPLSDIIAKSQNYYLKFRYGKGIGGYNTNTIFRGSNGVNCSWTTDIYNDCSLAGTGTSPNMYMTGYWYPNQLQKIDLNINKLLSVRKNRENIQYYINGTMILSQKSLDMKLVQSTLLIIGGSQLKYGNLYGGDQFSTSAKTGFKGIIDDVKIYNRALSDQEIAQQAKMAGF